jgi:dTDP-4-dehydrorhamnose reductase
LQIQGKKILLTGSTGMLGQALLIEILNKHGYEIYFISHSKSFTNSIANQLTLRDLVNHQFYAFFHCAAEVNVNLCENDLEHAKSVNCEYTKLLFENVVSEFSFYISTDSVYEGDIGNYNEMSDVRPVNNYATSKLMGEIVASNYTNNLYIIRTNIFGENSKSKSSIFEWAKSELLIGNSIPGFSNIFFNPLSVSHLSLILLSMLEEKIKFGTYNIGSDSYLSKYEFLVKVAEFLGVNSELVKPTEFVTSYGVANRPINTTMNCDKIKQNLINLDLSFQTSLDLLMKTKNEKN